MKTMKTLTCLALAICMLLGLGLAGAEAEGAGKIVVFQQKTEIYDQLVELAKAYQAETGVEVEVWPISGDDYYQNLKTYMVSESGPTVFTLNSASEIAEMGGYLADLSDVEVIGKVQENLIAKVEDKKAGIPMTAEGFGIIYNKSLVDPSAISTMDGLISYLESQKAAGLTGLGLSQEGYFLIGQILNFPFAVQEDPVAFCKQVFSGEVKLADVPEFQDFARLFVAIRANQTNPLEVTYDGNCGDFATGKTAAIHQGNWCYTMFSSYDVNFEMGMVGVPVGGNTAVAVGIPSYWFVNADASEEEQKLGKDFLNWLYSSKTGVDYLMNKFGFLPVVDGMQSENLDPVSASVAQAIAEGNIVDWTFNTEWPASVIMNDLVPVAEEFFTTEMSEADFLNALNEAFVTAANQ
ncbi:MAG: ABC transporter substrate-binding protein [Clostridiales bacterium]|nr:ABC transporter substrate-binding protein [Clostridiales bacterium]